MRVSRRRAHILRRCCYAVIIDLNQIDILTVLWCVMTPPAAKNDVRTYFEDKLGTSYDRIDRIRGIPVLEVTSLL